MFLWEDSTHIEWTLSRGGAKHIWIICKGHHDSEIEEDVSEEEDHHEVNSESDDSDYETNEETAIHSPQNKTFTSKHCEILWSSSQNICQAKLSAENIIKTVPGPSRMTVTRVTDITSDFELVMPNSIQKIIFEMTNLEGRRVLGGEVERAGQIAFACIFGVLVLAGAYKSKDESTASLWDAGTGRATSSHIFSRVIRFDNRETWAVGRERDKLAAIRTVWNCLSE